jgi:hypothetical protein
VIEIVKDNENNNDKNNNDKNNNDNNKNKEEEQKKENMFDILYNGKDKSMFLFNQFFNDIKRFGNSSTNKSCIHIILEII